MIYWFIGIGGAVALVIWGFLIREEIRSARYRKLREAVLPDLRDIRDAFGCLGFSSIDWKRWPETERGEVSQLTGAMPSGLGFRLTSETKEDAVSYWIELRRSDAEPIVFSVIDPQDELGETLERIFANGERLGKAFRDQMTGPSGKIRIKLDEVAGEHLN